MIPKPKHVKSRTIPGLIKILDIWFKRFIRLRDKNKACISCGSWYNERNIMQAGHYIPSTSRGTRWHEKNVSGQCAACNLYRHGNLSGYAQGLIKRYGPTVLDELDIAKSRHPHFDRLELEIMIADYKKKCKELGYKN